MVLAGIPASMTFNVHRGKGTRPMKPEDFLPRKPTIVSPEEAFEMLAEWADTHNRSIRA